MTGEFPRIPSVQLNVPITGPPYRASEMIQNGKQQFSKEVRFSGVGGVISAGENWPQFVRDMPCYVSP